MAYYSKNCAIEMRTEWDFFIEGLSAEEKQGVISEFSDSEWVEHLNEQRAQKQALWDAAMVQADLDQERAADEADRVADDVKDRDWHAEADKHERDKGGKGGRGRHRTGPGPHGPRGRAAPPGGSSKRRPVLGPGFHSVMTSVMEMLESRLGRFSSRGESLYVQDFFFATSRARRALKSAKKGGADVSIAGGFWLDTMARVAASPAGRYTAEKGLTPEQAMQIRSTQHAARVDAGDVRPSRPDSAVGYRVQTGEHEHDRRAKAVVKRGQISVFHVGGGTENEFNYVLATLNSAQATARREATSGRGNAFVKQAAVNAVDADFVWIKQLIVLHAPSDSVTLSISGYGVSLTCGRVTSVTTVAFTAGWGPVQTTTALHRGGGKDEVAQCPRARCVGDHWHRVANTDAKKSPLTGAEKRIAEKVKLCKVSQLVKCADGVSCFDKFPNAEHYHLTPDGQSRAVFDDTEYDVHTAPALAPTHPDERDEHLTHLAATHHPSLALQRAYPPLLEGVDSLDVRDLGDGGFQLAEPIHAAVLDAIKFTSGVKNMCFYRACVQMHSTDVEADALALFNALQADATVPDWVKETCQMGMMACDDLAPWVVKYTKRPLVIVDSVCMKVYMHSPFDDFMQADYVHFAASHFSACSQFIESRPIMGALCERVKGQQGWQYKEVAFQLVKGSRNPVARISEAPGPPEVAPRDDYSAYSMPNPVGGPLELEPDTPTTVTPVILPPTYTPPLNLVPASAEMGSEKFQVPETGDSSVATVSPGEQYLVCVDGWVRVWQSKHHRSWFHRETLPSGAVVFRKFNSTLQALGDELLPSYFKIVEPDTLKQINPSLGRLGHYYAGSEERLLVAPLTKHYNFVVQTRPHRWFKETRKVILDIANQVTWGLTRLNENTLYRAQTKWRESILVHQECLAGLMRKKSMFTVGMAQNRFLAAPVLEEYRDVPPDIIIDTLLFFIEYRCQAQSRMKGTTTSVMDYLKDERCHKMIRLEPRLTPLSIASAGGLSAWWDSQSKLVSNGMASFTAEVKAAKTRDKEARIPMGAHQFTSVEDAVAGHKEGLTIVHRKYYTSSDVSHGNATSPTVAPGGKFELMRASSGCGFSDPYVYYRTKSSPFKPGHQSVACMFASKMEVITKDTVETERAVLRLTSARVGEQELRTAQRVALDYALWERFKHHMQRYIDLTLAIQEHDPAYVAPEPRRVAAPTPLQEILHKVLCVREAGEWVLDEEVPKEEGTYLARLREYIRTLGVKTEQRYAAVQSLEDEVNPGGRSAALVTGSLKPHEGQKYKKGLLKYARLFIALPPSEWAQADVMRFKQLKNMYEKHLTIVAGVIDIEGRTEKLSFPMRDYWYRAVLTDTELAGLGAVVQEMWMWLSDHPGGLAVISHGDDQLYAENVDGHVVWTEADIEGNDGSHTAHGFRLAYLSCLEMGFDMHHAFKQLGRGVEIANATHPEEKVVLRSVDGEFLLTGHPGTTTFNTGATDRLGLAVAVAPELSVSEAARTLGLIVTVPVVRGELEHVTFLSKAFYLNKAGEIAAYTEVASLLRNFGRVTGDFLGSSKLCIVDRAMGHLQGVVQGWKHEPHTRLIRELTRLVGLPAREEEVDEEAEAAQTLRYYPLDYLKGVQDYELLLDSLAPLTTIYGVEVVSPYIDAMMGKRYGMEACCEK